MDDYSPFLNYWLYPRYLAAPLILLFFNAAPDKDGCDRTWRLLAAITITGITIILAILHKSAVRFEIYYACIDGFPDIAEGKAACKSLKDRIYYKGSFRQKGGIMWVTLFGGLGYPGIFECYWRIKHRKRIKALGKAFKRRWLSNLCIATFILTTILIIDLYYIIYFVL